MVKTSTDLRNLLARIDRKGYPAYKDTRGAYQFPAYVLSIDHVQGDPFAAPSKLSIHVNGKQAGFPRQLYQTPCRRIALQDALTRQLGRRAAQASFQAKGSGHSGLISISRCGQEVLERTACALDPETAKAIRDDRSPEHDDTCSMCGKFCAVRSMNKALSGEYIDIL